jgi:hypothetical protein
VGGNGRQTMIDTSNTANYEDSRVAHGVQLMQLELLI